MPRNLLKFNVITRPLREEYPVRQTDTQDAGILIIKVVVPIVDPRGKSFPKLCRDGTVLVFSKIPEIHTLAVRCKPVACDRYIGIFPS